jgi:hypothetical protein
MDNACKSSTVVFTVNSTYSEFNEAQQLFTMNSMNATMNATTAETEFKGQ